MLTCNRLHLRETDDADWHRIASIWASRLFKLNDAKPDIAPLRNTRLCRFWCVACAALQGILLPGMLCIYPVTLRCQRISSAMHARNSAMSHIHTQAGSVIDGTFQCCPPGSQVDRCGICNGDGSTCTASLQISTWSPTNDTSIAASIERVQATWAEQGLGGYDASGVTAMTRWGHRQEHVVVRCTACTVQLMCTLPHHEHAVQPCVRVRCPRIARPEPCLTLQSQSLDSPCGQSCSC